VTPFERAKSTVDSEPRAQSVGSTTKKSGMKSVWEGNSGDHVSVEQLALEHYEALGFKGYVCIFFFFTFLPRSQSNVERCIEKVPR
jgi:hypothetical protein